MVSKILAKLETIARRIQLKYMASHRTTEVVEPGRILFHPQDCRKKVLEEYQKRIKKLGIV